MTTRANLYVDQGVDFLVSLELNTDDGTDYTITTEQFFCQVRKIYSTALAFEAELDIVVNGVTNEIEIYIAPEKTKNVVPGKYKYDIIMKKSGDQTQKILEGLMFVLPTVTQLEEE